MNERIFKLAGQAISEVPAPLDFHHEHFLFAEKFAELIVKECNEVLRLVPYNSNVEFGDEVIYQDAIKEHFGVE